MGNRKDNSKLLRAKLAREELIVLEEQFLDTLPRIDTDSEIGEKIAHEYVKDLLVVCTSICDMNEIIRQEKQDNCSDSRRR